MAKHANTPSRHGHSTPNAARASESPSGAQPRRQSRSKSRSKAKTSAAYGNFGSCTNIGLVRDHNEDSLLVRAPLYVVADGMGGHAAGEVASEIAVQVIGDQAPSCMDSTALGRAVESANRAILEAAAKGRGREGMGTTVTAALLQGERLIVAQVGDSRAYLLHQGTIQQLTRDHSLMADLIESGRITPEEAKTHPQRSVITRALGAAPYTRPDLYELNVQTGDRLLLCSDGLSGMVSDGRIETALSTIADPQECADRLIQMALDAGGHDNVTAIVVDIEGFAEARSRKAGRKTHRTVAVIVAALVVVCAAAGCGLNYFLSNSAYLADYQGKVAIYQGIPGQVIEMNAGQPLEVSDVSTSDLSPTTASRLKDEGIKVDSVDAARNLISEYRDDIARNASARSAKTSAGSASAGSNATAASATSVGGSTATAASATANSAASASATSTGSSQEAAR